MNNREKLIELIEQVYFCSIEMLADHLIANGVTVQKEADLYWKPVSVNVWNLTCSACDSHLGCRQDAEFCPRCGARFARFIDLPELQKEEALWENRTRSWRSKKH